MRTTHILFTGGGSGGHVYPLLAVAEALQKISGERALVLHYLGPKDAYTPLIAGAGMYIHTLLAGKLRRYFSIENFLDIPKFLIGTLQAFFKMWWIMPDAVFSKGGTGALPVVFAAWFYRIPVIIHESDTIPGITNAISARFARRIGISFEAARTYFNPSLTAWTGHPMRPSLISRALNSAQAKQQLGFLPDQPLVLVIGGSLGATRINDVVLESLKGLIPIAQVLHQVGPANYEDVSTLARAALMDTALTDSAKHPYKAVPYIDDMGLALSAADLVVTRAGSSSIFEIAAFGKPMILVPLFESANDHQRANAMAFAEGGGGIVIEENNLFPGLLVKAVKDILTDPTKQQTMGQAAKTFAKVDGARMIAEELLRLS